MNENILPKRERLVMDIVHALGNVTVADVQSSLPDAPTYAATRMLLQRLQKKGLLTFEQDGPRYVYSASEPRHTAAANAWERLIATFFDGSAISAVSSLLGHSQLSAEEIEELEAMIKTKKAERGD